MKKTITLSISLIMYFLSFSQTEKKEKGYELGFFDAHIITVKIDSSIYKAKDNCIYKKGTLCNLYKVDIKEVYFSSQNHSFDSISVKRIKYLLAPSKFEDNLLVGNEYLITVFGTPSMMYLGFSKVLHLNDPESFRFYHRKPFITAITKCKKRNGFEKFIKKYLID